MTLFPSSELSQRTQPNSTRCRALHISNIFISASAVDNIAAQIVIGSYCFILVLPNAQDERDGRDARATEIEAFLSHLVIAGNVSASIRNPAKSALPFFIGRC
jgi:hypothetical protein